MNLLLAGSYLLIMFFATVFIYKYSGKVGLIVWIVLNLIISNIQTVKIIEIMGNCISLGNISYSSIFLATDILNEKYGKKIAQKSVYVSFIAIVIFTFAMAMTLNFIPASVDSSQEHLMQIFSYLPQITIGSLLAYLISQLLDTTLYQWLHKHNAKLWIKNNISTIISQIVDSIIFVSIAYFNVIELSSMIELIVTMCSWKILLAFFDTPFVYMVSKMKNKNELV